MGAPPSPLTLTPNDFSSHPCIRIVFAHFFTTKVCGVFGFIFFEVHFIGVDFTIVFPHSYYVNVKVAEVFFLDSLDLHSSDYSWWGLPWGWPLSPLFLVQR